MAVNIITEKAISCGEERKYANECGPAEAGLSRRSPTIIDYLNGSLSSTAGGTPVLPAKKGFIAKPSRDYMLWTSWSGFLYNVSNWIIMEFVGEVRNETAIA